MGGEFMDTAKMIELPPRGKVKEDMTFGYVDVPETITLEHRPFLDNLTKASLTMQQEIRNGREIDVSFQDVKIPTNGAEMKMRIFLPEGKGAFPLVLYYHGGGFAIRNIDCYDYIGRYIAKNSGAVVCMPEYSLAPEYRYPTQLNQCYDALIWARNHAAEYQASSAFDVVMGDSAGGNLAAVVSLLCRDRGIRVPCKQILAYPVVDMAMEHKRESETLYGKGYNLDYDHVKSYCGAYFECEDDRWDSYASPLLAPNPRDLPSCVMILAECDVLIDQGLEYLKRLKDAGVEVNYTIFHGMPHDFLSYAYEESYEAYDLICREVKAICMRSHQL